MTKPSQIKKIAIVGLGSIGARHLRLIKEIKPEMEVVLVRSGLGIKRCEEKLANFQVDSIQDAVDHGVEAAIISTPASLHIEHARSFINSNIPCLIEKPLSSSERNLKEFASFIEKNPIKILVGYNLRYREDAKYFKSLLNDPRIGRIVSAQIEAKTYLPDWRPDIDYRKSVSARKELGGGVLLELSHEVDYMFWFFGECSVVNSELRNSGQLDIKNVEDQVSANLVNINDIKISLNLDFSSASNSRNCTIITDTGLIEWDLLTNTITSKIRNFDFVKKFDFDYDSSYKIQLETFFKFIESNEHETSSIKSAIYVMNLISEIRRASQ